MAKVLNTSDFIGLKRYDKPTRCANIRYYDNDNFLKVTLADDTYLERLISKKLPGHNVPWDYYSISNAIKIIISSPYNQFNDYKTAIIFKILKGFKPLHEVDFHKKDFKNILEMIRTVFYYNAMAVESGFIHSDYNPGNILLDNNLNPIIIDLDESIVDGYKCTTNYMTPNSEYLYGTKYLDGEKEVINCDKVTLLNMLLMILLNGKDYCDARINKTLVKRNIKMLKLPEEYERKYVDILANQKIPDDGDFFVDDFDCLIKGGYHLK